MKIHLTPSEWLLLRNEVTTGSGEDVGKEEHLLSTAWSVN